MVVRKLLRKHSPEKTLIGISMISKSKGIILAWPTYKINKVLVQTQLSLFMNLTKEGNEHV